MGLGIGIKTSKQLLACPRGSEAAHSSFRYGLQCEEWGLVDEGHLLREDL